MNAPLDWKAILEQKNSIIPFQSQSTNKENGNPVDIFDIHTANAVRMIPKVKTDKEKRKKKAL